MDGFADITLKIKDKSSKKGHKKAIEAVKAIEALEA
jgi:hypothetical protein